MSTHLIIPDTQVKEGVPLEHLEALGNYIVAKKPEKIIHLGDHADMESLSIYDKRGSKSFEGRRYRTDITWAQEGMETLLKPLQKYNRHQRKNKKGQYNPEMILTLGNHENRINRALEEDPRLDGVMSVDDLEYEKYGWNVIPFLQPITVDGVMYCHYFVNMESLKKGVLAGTIDNKIRKIGRSFVHGHQQVLQYGIKYLNDGTPLQGIAAGAFYMHDEEYMGIQGNHHWRGIIMLHEVEDGSFDPMFVSLNYLLENYL